MNRGRGGSDPPADPLQHQAAPSKPNRLRRSFRRTQQTQTAAELDSPKSQQPDFKTPTRIPRSRVSDGFSGESPHNDSDFQQDIIWDATSPSPNRLGKRGKKQPAGVVNISEIVSRIAPKHGRPKVAEPTLQQWIGDSAAIPCTPDVQVPKPKKKSPRPNGVDDLLKLAKQFDFNMFRQDEEEVEELQQQSLELLSGDILDFENGEQSHFSPSPPENCEPPAGTDIQLHLDQLMDDDLDFLFDGPTQHLSGNLSQTTSQVKPGPGASSGKPSASSHAHTTNTKAASGRDEFEDDWDNDDLLNDSLVLEMTQNPQNFTAPTHCSTQKPASQTKHQKESPAHVSAQSAAPKVEKDNLRQRSTFKLESNPNFSFKRVQTDTWAHSKVDYSSKTAEKDTQRSRFPPGNGVSACRSWQTNTVKLDSQFQQRTSSAKYNMAATKSAQSDPVVSAPAASDLQDEDLSAFFLSDPVWDDPADDDLLCEMCDDVENQIRNVQNVSSRQTLPVSNQRAALQPANRNQQPAANQQPFLPKKQTPAAPPGAPGRPAGSSLAGGFSFNGAGQMKTVTDSFRPAINSSAGVQASSRAQPAPQFTFKKPNIPVSMVTSKAGGKCSAAEIEQKKQQAMERRRQRLQAAQNI
ncbi:ewing's tumor-associated antigen 1 [Centropristis striata]|uniref:ewing's tumor-associated antigen 1 n=1 Tax=Centropristis striata TaxID=184440 RepID=UPI0027E02196|nr:ewing's tumor-associated antigen 1 [Centropristis striata]